MFPHQLTDSRAFDIARRCSRASTATTGCSARPAARPSALRAADWHGQQRAQRERIEFYDKRVERGGGAAAARVPGGELSMDTWQQVKLHYIGLLTNHHQPELAETFFNSVTAKLLHRSYFHNDFIFVRPAVSTEYIENDEPARPTYRAYYPTRHAARHLARIVTNFQLRAPFEDLDRDIDSVLPRLSASWAASAARQLPDPGAVQPVLPQQGRLRGRQDHQRLHETPFALPILHARGGPAQLVIDAVLFGEDDLLMLFSYARAYFMVTWRCPAAYVQFLRSPDAAQAARRALQRAGPAEAGQEPVLPRLPLPPAAQQRPFRIAPGIKGMVMLVFDLPSFPVRLQGHQGLLPAAEGHHARADQGQVPAREAARPRRPHGRHAGVQQRGLPARALRGRAGRRAAALLPQPARDLRRRRRRGRDQATSTSSAA
jgi:isocitrate dehydrogenase kinase/phosphatase